MALPNPALGDDTWEISEEDARVEGGRRKLGEAPNRMRAESDLLRLSTRSVLGDECLAVNLGQGPTT